MQGGVRVFWDGDAELLTKPDHFSDQADDSLVFLLCGRKGFLEVSVGIDETLKQENIFGCLRIQI